MAQRRDFNRHSNDDLVRLLYQNPSSSKPSKGPASQLPETRAEDPEPLASRRVSELPPQSWPLSDRRLELEPVSDREERSLFAALSRGSKLNLGREPTVPELMLLVQRLNDARAFVMEVERVMRGEDTVYVRDGRIVFSRLPEGPQTQGSANAA
jgi:hypothetical protein